MSKASLLVGIQFVLFTLLAISFFIFPVQRDIPIKIIGILMILIGLFIFQASLRAHKTTPNISPVPNSQAELVENGIYGHIRHPIYTSVFLCGIGAALLHGHITSIAIAVILIPFFTYKSMYEETLLKQVYPQYSDYMQRTGRFFPSTK